MPSAPLEVLFDTLLEVSKEYIGNHESRDSQNRDSVGIFLHHFGILNKESFKLTLEDASFPAVVYYERVRMNLLHVFTHKTFPDFGKVGFFWEGVPRQLSLALPTALLMHQNKARDLTSCDVFVQRSRFMEKLEYCKSERDIREIGVDLSIKCSSTLSVPMRVHAFVLVMRSIFCGLRSAKSSMHFRQCCNQRCNRVFFSNSKHQLRECFDAKRVTVETLDSPSCIPCDENVNYWNRCGSFPVYSDPLERFCTSACCIEWRRRLDSLLPQGIVFDADLTLSSGSLSRIDNALKNAIKRNCDFQSKLGVNVGSKRMGCISKRLFKHEVETRIDVLNIDTALLYWSTIVSKLPRYANDDTLPGRQPHWRSLRVNVERCSFVSQLYSKILEQQRHVRLITDPLSSQKLFSAVKSQCMLIDKGVPI